MNLCNDRVKSGLIATEVGYRMPYTKTNSEKGFKPGRNKELNIDLYSEEYNAWELVKYFVLLAGNGVNKTLYWKIRTHKDTSVVALYNPTKTPNEFQPLKAAGAFKILTSSLNGKLCDTKNTAPYNGEMMELRFRGGEKPDLSAAWSAMGENIVKPVGEDCVPQVYDIYGSVVY